MTKPRCETCPWWTRGGETYSCHHHASTSPEPAPRWWCSLHPDAPKPVYDHYWTFEGHEDLPNGKAGWEPINGTAASDGVRWFSLTLWRRITGYTGGDDD